MSAQQLSRRSIKRIATSTGLDIVMAWSHGGYEMAFVTADHRHGTWDKKTGGVQFATSPVHYSSCATHFEGAK